jgi:hypothetical protein
MAGRMSAFSRTIPPRAVRYSTDKPPQSSEVALTRQSDALVVPVNARVSGAWLFMFAEDPSVLHP